MATDRAQIATVHAFSWPAALLHERPVEARVDPYFSTLSRFEANLVQTEVWREWLAQEMDRSPDRSRTSAPSRFDPDSHRDVAQLCS